MSKPRFYFFILIIIFITFIFFYFKTQKKEQLPEKPIVAVVTSFNNAKWVYKNLDSIFCQDYKNFHVIYLDDCSTDGTPDLVEQYIKEKNVADKITLIKNKKRLLKIQNLYAIYHSIGDWDIIAQIDGDDWLAHNHVFKLVNQAYCNGCWLAYTQFETSNGHKGCNALPPYWVRKTGAFRTYRPWFMYSHLKTFYAWLFKQIKLQDFFDDHEGIFQPLNDDAYMMYPMLEMARNHISFIQKVCYVFNVDPGYRPSLKGPKNNLFEEVLKRPAYHNLEQPISNSTQYKDYQADLFIFAKHNDVSLLQNVIKSIKQYVSDIQKIYVLHNFSEDNLQLIKKLHLKVRLINTFEVSTELEKFNDYVLLATDDSVFAKKISLEPYIKEMEKTFAFGFFFNVEYNDFNEKNLMCQHIYDDIYAWKFGCSLGREHKDMKMMLCRKKDIFLNSNDFLWLGDHFDVNQFIKKNSIDKNMIGLFQDAKKI